MSSNFSRSSSRKRNLESCEDRLLWVHWVWTRWFWRWRGQPTPRNHFQSDWCKKGVRQCQMSYLCPEQSKGSKMCTCPSAEIRCKPNQEPTNATSKCHFLYREKDYQKWMFGDLRLNFISFSATTAGNCWGFMSLELLSMACTKEIQMLLRQLNTERVKVCIGSFSYPIASPLLPI